MERPQKATSWPKEPVREPQNLAEANQHQPDAGCASDDNRNYLTVEKIRTLLNAAEMESHTTPPEPQKNVSAPAGGLVSTKQAATYLGLSVSTLNKWRWKGCGPRFVKLERRVTYSLKDLDKFIEAHSFQSTSEYQE